MVREHPHKSTWFWSLDASSCLHAHQLGHRLTHRLEHLKPVLDWQGSSKVLTWSGLVVALLVEHWLAGHNHLTLAHAAANPWLLLHNEGLH